MLGSILLVPLVIFSIGATIFILTMTANNMHRLKRIFRSWKGYLQKEKTLLDLFGTDPAKYWKEDDALTVKKNDYNYLTAKLITFHNERVLIEPQGSGWPDNTASVLDVAPSSIEKNHTADTRKHLEKAEDYQKEIKPLLSA